MRRYSFFYIKRFIRQKWIKRKCPHFCICCKYNDNFDVCYYELTHKKAGG